MKRFLLASLLVLAIACGKDSTAPKRTQIKVVNSSAQTIQSYFFSDCTATSWGGDRLGADVLAPGQSRAFDVAPGCYDMLAETATSVSELSGQTVASGQIFTHTVTN